MIKNRIYSLSNSTKYIRFCICKNKFTSLMQQVMIAKGIKFRLTSHSNIRPDNSECSELWRITVVQPFKFYRKVCKYDSAFNRKEYYKPFCKYGNSCQRFNKLKNENDTNQNKFKDVSYKIV